MKRHLSLRLVTLIMAFVLLRVFASVSTVFAAADSSTSTHHTYPPAPDQSTVALKTEPKTISATDKDVASAIGPKDIAAAEKMVGKTGFIKATINEVYSPQGHGIVFLDLDRDYHNSITVMARPANYAKLPNLSALENKTVLISGTFIDYKGKPEIELKSASQIEIIK